MTREYLEGLGLDKDTIGKIMAENGKDIEHARNSEKSAFETERSQLTSQITDLKGQIATRDSDLESLNSQLAASQGDATKFAEAQSALTDLRTKYDTEKQTWEKKLQDQAYEFAVREETGKLKFSSASAKSEFERRAIAAGFKQDNGKLLGFNDFVENYRATDAAAFAPEPAPAEPKPPVIVLPGKERKPEGRHISLAEMMKAKNENPKMDIKFDD